jgi:hypothetical protein
MELNRTIHAVLRIGGLLAPSSWVCASIHNLFCELKSLARILGWLSRPQETLRIRIKSSLPFGDTSSVCEVGIQPRPILFGVGSHYTCDSTVKGFTLPELLGYAPAYITRHADEKCTGIYLLDFCLGLMLLRQRLRLRGFALPYLFSMRLHTEHVFANVKWHNTSSAEGESLPERNRSLWALHPRIYVTSYENVV